MLGLSPTCLQYPFAYQPRKVLTTKAVSGSNQNLYGGVKIQSSLISEREVFHDLEDGEIWEGTQEINIWQASVDLPLSPVWKMLVLTDGSVTRHLQTLSGLHVEVDCLEMKELPHPDIHNGLGKGLIYSTIPKEVDLIPGDNILQRQVLLRSPDPRGIAYVYAASWWNASTVNEYLKDADQPIWVSLSKEKREMYREVRRVFCGTNEQLEEYFGAKEKFWGRQYVFWHRGEVLTVLHEVFSSKLQQYLGPYSG